MLRICAPERPFSSPSGRHNQTDPLPASCVFLTGGYHTTALDRLVRTLDYDIAAEEERAQISDRSDVAYPILARTLAVRRDNLRDTIAALEPRLANLAVVSIPELA
jgi:hypothetical protein